MWDGLQIIKAVIDAGAAIKVLDRSYIDLTTPMGRGFMAMMSAMAEDERLRIIKRTHEGRKIAQAKGVRMGRKPKLTPHQQEEARRRIAKGETTRELAKSYGVSVSTISRARGVSAVGKKRFFYHSFPRRGSNTDAEIDKGCKILSLVCDEGLLLAPEVVKWQYPHADGSPPRTQTYIQRRACFTELAPADLSEHAEIFGRFALEFEIDVLKGMGALPVFYIPQATTREPSEINNLGSVLVNQMIDAAVLAMRMAELKTIADAAPDGTRLNVTMGLNKFKDFSLHAKETRNTLEALNYG